MSSEPAVEERAVGRGRAVALSVFLIVLSLLYLLGETFGITHREELCAEYPRLESWLWYIYLSCPGIGIVSNLAMWSWRRWGFWLAMAGGVLVLAIELYTMGFAPHMARVPITMGLLVALVRPVWSRFR